MTRTAREPHMYASRAYILNRLRIGMGVAQNESNAKCIVVGRLLK